MVAGVVGVMGVVAVVEEEHVLGRAVAPAFGGRHRTVALLEGVDGGA